MKNMVKIKISIIGLLLLAGGLAGLVLPTQATNELKTGWGSAGENLNTVIGDKSGLQSNIETPLVNLISGVLAAVGTIFLILTIYAGILWMTAAGNDSKTDSAKSILTAAVIGLVIVISAYAITRLVRTYTTKDVCPTGNCTST